MQWLVVSDNSAIFQGIGTINGEGLYTYRVDATDGDSDTLTFSCDRTDLFTFDTSTGVATWTPDYTQGGTYTIDFGVSDFVC